jgi:hypothetical protein
MTPNSTDVGLPEYLGMKADAGIMDGRELVAWPLNTG